MSLDARVSASEEQGGRKRGDGTSDCQTGSEKSVGVAGREQYTRRLNTII